MPRVSLSNHKTHSFVGMRQKIISSIVGIESKEWNYEDYGIVMMKPHLHFFAQEQVKMLPKRCASKNLCFLNS
jgi:hypothetical protein